MEHHMTHGYDSQSCNTIPAHKQPASES